MLSAAPSYARPALLDVVSRDVEEVAAEAIGLRPTQMIFYAGDINPMFGGPSQNSVGGIGVAPTWGMQKATVTTLGVVTRLPSTWVAYDIVAYGAPGDTAGGVVALRAARVHGGVGDNLATGVTTESVVTDDVGIVAGVLHAVTLASGITTPDAGDFVGIQIARRVAEGSDTYTGRWDLVAVALVEA